jgi:hypothetical protein
MLIELGANIYLIRPRANRFSLLVIPFFVDDEVKTVIDAGAGRLIGRSNRSG